MKTQVWVVIGVLILMFGVFLVTTDKASTTGQVIGDEKVLIDGEAPPVPAEQRPAESPKVEEITPTIITSRIINYAFSPTIIKVNVGDTIVWENLDSVGHTVTSDDGIEMQSRLLAKGERYSHTFTTRGEYPYYCKPHPYMRGTVIVE